MMHSRIRFFRSKWFIPVSFDDDLLKRRRPASHELGTFIRLIGVAEGYWKWLLMPIVLTIGFESMELLWPWLGRLIIDEMVPTKNWQGFWLIFWLLTANRIFANTMFHLIDAMGSFMGQRLCLWLRVQYYRHLQKLSITYIERRGVGDHMFRMIADLESLRGLMSQMIPTLIRQVYVLVMGLLFLYILDLNLVIIILAYEVFYFVSAHLLTTVSRHINFMEREASALAKSRLQEGFSGIVTVKAFGRERGETNGYLHRLIMSRRVNVVRKLYDTVTWTLFRGDGFFPHFKEFGIMCYLYYEVMRGRMTYGAIIPVIVYLKKIENPMTSIVDLWQNIRAQLTWAERIFQVWDMKPSVVNVANPRLPHRLAGDISVENVSFAYENGFQALHDVSLRIVPGQFAALVGPSGSGKTTLLNLMLRLADPAGGRITMDGVDIREFDYSKYQQSLGIVMQETFLSKETLRWNMMLSNWQADDDEILEALERRRLMNWYRALPAGLDSLLNEGTRVSSGEKQRLGVARALIRKSRVLFLDEPTSSLDLDTEKEVMEVINEVRQGKTTVLVTHRLNTVVNADRLMVMDRGNVVETGTHDELVRNGGIYSRLNDLFYGSKAAA